MIIRPKGRSDVISVESAMKGRLTAREYDQGVFEDMQEEIENLKRFACDLMAVLVDHGAFTRKELGRLVGPKEFNVTEQ